MSTCVILTTMIGTGISLVFIPVLFLAFFILILQPILLGLRDGWGRLYKHYQSGETYKGFVWYPLIFVWKGDSGYMRYTFPLMKIGADKEYLYIGTSLLFQLGRQWVVIPWDDIEVRKRAAVTRNEFLFKGAIGVSLLITTHLLRHLEQASEKYWSI